LNNKKVTNQFGEIIKQLFTYDDIIIPVETYDSVGVLKAIILIYG